MVPLRHNNLEVVTEGDGFGRVLLAKEGFEMIDDQVGVVVGFDKPVEVVEVMFIGEEKGKGWLLGQVIVTTDDIFDWRDG